MIKSVSAKKQNRRASFFRNNQGSTLVEMIVCFALLAIFMVCASMIISTITTMYYDIKGEIYSREVSDIVMEKLASEIDGAEYYNGSGNSLNNPTIASDNKTITLTDKTGTRVSLTSSEDKGVIIKYLGYSYRVNGFVVADKSRDATEWFFDKAVYNGFTIEDMQFYKGGSSSSITPAVATEYNVSSDLSGYGEDVVLVLLKMKSERYGTHYFNRFIRMYNVPASAVTPSPTPNPGG